MSEPDSNPEKRIALFQRKEVRRVIHNAGISKATLGLTPTEYAEFKRLKRENLRDRSGGHPACRRGRASCRPEKTPAIQWPDDFRITFASSCAGSAGLEARLYGRQDARRYTGNARRELEKKSGRKVVTSESFLACQHDRCGRGSARMRPSAIQCTVLTWLMPHND